MTVKELMDILKKLDGDMPVVAAKYELGFDEVREYRIVDLAFNVNTYSSDSCSPHELARNIQVNGHRVSKALLLGELEPSLTMQER